MSKVHAFELYENPNNIYSLETDQTEQSVKGGCALSCAFGSHKNQKDPGYYTAFSLN